MVGCELTDQRKGTRDGGSEDRKSEDENGGHPRKARGKPSIQPSIQPRSRDRNGRPGEGVVDGESHAHCPFSWTLEDEMGEAEWARSRRHNSITPAIIWSAMILTTCQFPCQCQLMSLPVSLCSLPCALRPYHTVAYISQSQSQSQTKPRTITINNNNRKPLLGFDCLDQYRGHGWRMASTDEHNPTRHVH
jgi:hypothetical protein